MEVKSLNTQPKPISAQCGRGPSFPVGSGDLLTFMVYVIGCHDFWCMSLVEVDFNNISDGISGLSRVPHQDKLTSVQCIVFKWM